jgi:hypothetical protein
VYPVHPHQVITDDQFGSLLEHGYLILPEYIRGEELAMLQAAQRRVLKPWEEARDNPPESVGGPHTMFVPYPYPDVTMTGLYRHPQLLDLGRRYLKTPDVIFRVGYMLARYPGFVSKDTGHIDNGNNSLLPMSETAREYGQLGFWIHLEEVTADQAPLLLCSNARGRDIRMAEPLVCPAGTIAVFSNYAWHASSSYRGATGERFTWAFALGRADHPFEGLLHYTAIGNHPVFKQVISECSAEERCLFRFPPPHHRYYTRQTLAALEQQYPGWNARGEYHPTE